jgi:hypothetical protein
LRVERRVEIDQVDALAVDLAQIRQVVVVIQHVGHAVSVASRPKNGRASDAAEVAVNKNMILRCDDQADTRLANNRVPRNLGACIRDSGKRR